MSRIGRYTEDGGFVTVVAAVLRPVALVLALAAVGGGVAVAVNGLPTGAETEPAAANPSDGTPAAAVGLPEAKLPAAPAIGPPPPRAEAEAPPAGRVTIAAVGDIVMGTTGALPPDGGKSFFSGVVRRLTGDVVLGNLEGTLSTGSGSKCSENSTNCFAFQMPPSYARWLAKAGFTVLNLANNHAFDYGPEGLAQTVRALDRRRLLHTGRPGEMAIQVVDGIRVAFLGFSSYPWSASLLDIGTAKRLVRQAVRQADIVVVTFHGGAEGSDRTHVPRGTEFFLGENRGNLRAFAHAVVNAGADLVVGHGPHVLRGMEWYKGRLIAYSMGNFAGYKVFSLAGPLGVSGILRVTLRADGSWVKGNLVATRLARDGVPALDPAEAAHGAVRTLSAQDFGKRAIRVSRTGVLSPPPAR